MPTAVHARIHVPMTIGIPLGLHTTTVVHVHIRAYTYKGAPLGLQMPNAVVYAHPRKVRLTSSSKHSDRTPRHGKQHAAVQHHTSSTRPFPGTVCKLYARVLNSHAQTNTQTHPYVHYSRNPRSVCGKMGQADALYGAPKYRYRH